LNFQLGHSFSLVSSEKAESGRARAILTKGRAIALVSGEVEYVVVILGTNSISVPGTEAQKILLLDGAGKVNDRLSCGINSRYGSLVTEFPQDDKAQFVIRFVSATQSGWHNWHTINYEGQSYTFWTKERAEQVDWVRRGLVRLAVRDGKLSVIFPELTRREGSPVRVRKGANFEEATYLFADSISDDRSLREFSCKCRTNNE
jgi:hypothetical protein